MTRTTAPGSSSGHFVDKADGIPGTEAIAFDQEAHQEEIMAVIEAASLTPSAADNTQLLAAIRKICMPVGFVYTQLPGKSAPATLYPWATWTDRSSQFAGLFFRAEGGKALAFGAGTQADAMQGHKHGATLSSGSVLSTDGSDSEVGLASTATTTSEPVTDGVNGTPRTADETRPSNVTVRIWERTA